MMAVTIIQLQFMINVFIRYYMDGIERSGDTIIIHNSYGRTYKVGYGTWSCDYFLKDQSGKCTCDVKLRNRGGS
jgi:hypothetical protein